MRKDIKVPSHVVDLRDDAVPGANMYGCQPCPRCGSRYRLQEADEHPVISCHECDHREEGVDVEAWLKSQEAEA